MNLIGNINAIPFRRFRGGGGVAPFPNIPGMIARYSALGLTNEQMATNPVWVDKTGNGHDLQMKNFAWGGMSGVGGYSDNFSSDSWKKPSDRSDITWTSSSFNITRVMNTGVQIYYHSSWEESESVIPEKRIIVKGLEDGQVLRYMNVGNRIIEISQDGIYTIPSFTFKGANSYHGYSLAKKQESCNVTVEQLPLYPGALVFDGVDDYGTCDNFPILNKEKGYTVVALRQWIEEKNSITALVSNSKNWNKDGAFVFEYNNLENNYSNIGISFGFNNMFDRGLSPYSYQTSKSYNGNLIESGSFLGSDKLVVARANENLSPNSNVAIWELVFLDHDATEEELAKIKDYFVKTYPWLFPNQAWTVVGKTNEDEDRATIANITGNGNDLVLSNFGFAEGSGYGLYGFKFFSKAGIEYYSGSKISFSKHQLDQITLIPYILVYPGTSYPREKDITAKIKVAGLKEGVSLTWGWAGNTELTITEDGTYSISAGSGKLRQLDVVYAEGFDPDHVVTIEQIPEYEGYLVTDGVDDKVVSAESIAFTDTWTIITDTVFLGKVSVASGILASNIFTVYNYQGSGTIAVTMGEGGSSLRVITSSIKAFSSDGTIYDAEWNEYHVEIGTIRALERLLKIGTSSNETSYFCQLAFKFLGIYNGFILGKDSCIKAYNYLQTLKAK